MCFLVLYSLVDLKRNRFHCWDIFSICSRGEKANGSDLCCEPHSEPWEKTQPSGHPDKLGIPVLLGIPDGYDIPVAKCRPFLFFSEGFPLNSTNQKRMPHLFRWRSTGHLRHCHMSQRIGEQQIRARLWRADAHTGSSGIVPSLWAALSGRLLRSRNPWSGRRVQGFECRNPPNWRLVILFFCFCSFKGNNSCLSCFFFFF